MEDLPGKPSAISHTSCVSETSKNAFSKHYRLQQHHVALALRYNRLHGHVHENYLKYLRSLLKPFKVDARHDDHIWGYLEAWPTVSAHTSVLYTHWRFVSTRPGCHSTGMDNGFRLYPHQIYLRDAWPPNSLLDAIDSRFKKGSYLWNYGKSFSCPDCPTEFWIRFDDRELEIRVRQSLATNRHPYDEPWLMQTMADGERGVNTIKYMPGAVRALIDEANRAWRAWNDRGR